MVHDEIEHVVPHPITVGPKAISDNILNVSSVSFSAKCYKSTVIWPQLKVIYDYWLALFITMNRFKSIDYLPSQALWLFSDAMRNIDPPYLRIIAAHKLSSKFVERTSSSVYDYIHEQFVGLDYRFIIDNRNLLSNIPSWTKIPLRARCWDGRLIACRSVVAFGFIRSLLSTVRS
ncbi:hypothetical protein DICVIV_05839 [Dictyocaulus viviparus]|uniref:Uncharacterized protein n=1 Tax=Dictyocaulus viviparus TaxID=29172 RepID=A0A0D8XW87_DICVI|nr:hypothetical protein DICVIV_05839 [Dictyocaulus viviparus]